MHKGIQFMYYVYTYIYIIDIFMTQCDIKL